MQDAWENTARHSCLKKCVCPSDGSSCTLADSCDKDQFACKEGYQRFSDGSTRCAELQCREGSLGVSRILSSTSAFPLLELQIWQRYEKFVGCIWQQITYESIVSHTFTNLSGEVHSRHFWRLSLGFHLGFAIRCSLFLRSQIVSQVLQLRSHNTCWVCRCAGSKRSAQQAYDKLRNMQLRICRGWKWRQALVYIRNVKCSRDDSCLPWGIRPSCELSILCSWPLRMLVCGECVAYVCSLLHDLQILPSIVLCQAYLWHDNLQTASKVLFLAWQAACEDLLWTSCIPLRDFYPNCIFRMWGPNLYGARVIDSQVWATLPCLSYCLQPKMGNLDTLNHITRNMKAPQNLFLWLQYDPSAIHRMLIHDCCHSSGCIVS